MRHPARGWFLLVALPALSMPCFAAVTINANSVSGHYSNYDRMLHMYSFDDSGNVYEIVNRSGAYFLAEAVGQVRALTSYYDQYYGDDHVIIANSEGIEEVWYQPGNGVHVDWIFHPGFDPGFTVIGGFYSQADRNQHVVAAATNNATVTEFWWGPSTGGVQSRTLIVMPGIISGLSAYYTPYDRMMHTAVTLRSLGATPLWEVYWASSPGGVSAYELTGVDPELIGVGAFGTDYGGPADYEDFLMLISDRSGGDRLYGVVDLQWFEDIMIGSILPESSGGWVGIAGWASGGTKYAVLRDASGGVWMNYDDAGTWTPLVQLGVCNTNCHYVGP